MKPTQHQLQKRFLHILAGIVVVALGTWTTVASMEHRQMNKHEKLSIERSSKSMRTVCVGRFLIDLPKETKIELRQARIDGFDISTFGETEGEFEKRVADRESQIRARPDWRGGDNNLESARDVKTKTGLVGKIFIHSRTVEEGTQGNGLGGVERYRDEGITVEALVHGDGISIDLFFEDRNPALIEDLPRLDNQLVANPNNRIPSEPGFCIDRAYVRDPLRADQCEQAMMFGRLPNHPDVEFMFSVSAGLKPGPHGVLARNDAADQALSMADRMRITRFRAAPREIGGLAGEELAELVVDENEARGHSFRWEVNGTEENVFVPHLVFRMSTGNGNRKPVPSSLSDGAALGLWDKMSSSIRLRSSEPATNRLVEAPTTPLGTYASARERCPEKGWWRCVSEELVRLGVEKNDAHVYTVRSEVNGTEENVFLPHLVFQMDTGQGKDGPVPMSISEEAALLLSDRSVGSFRDHRAPKVRGWAATHTTTDRPGSSGAARSREGSVTPALAGG